MIAQSRISHSRIDTARSPLATTILPIIVIALAGWAVRTPLAAAYPLAALLLFTWIAADTLTLALIARTPNRRPPARAVLGTLAGASVVVALGTPAPLRAVLIETPLLAVSMIALIIAHVGGATRRARRALHDTTGGIADRWQGALAEIFPPALVRLAAAELAILHMALFRWGGPADVPAAARAFGYHKHLTPMCAALLILSAIEIAVYHLLVGHWSRTAAIVMFVLSDLGFVYLIGLVKSFRFRPILLTPQGAGARRLADRPNGPARRHRQHRDGFFRRGHPQFRDLQRRFARLAQRPAPAQPPHRTHHALADAQPRRRGLSPRRSRTIRSPAEVAAGAVRRLSGAELCGLMAAQRLASHE